MKMLTPNQVGGDLAAIGRALEAGSFAETLRGPVREQMTTAVEENFANVQGPEGQAWPARKVAGDGHPLLVKSGTLKAEATRGQAEATDRELTLTVDLVYAATHQYGRADANIPARPYLGASERHLDRIGEIVGERGQQLLDEV